MHDSACRFCNQVTSNNPSSSIDFTTMSDIPVPVTDSKPKQVRTYQPTYQLNPRKPFSEERVRKIVTRIVDSELAEIEYNDKEIPELCLTLAEMLRDAVKELSYDRYRIIVCVSIGQKRQQSMNVYHTFLWDAERDNYVAHNFENCHIFANVVVYGIYLD